VSETHPAPAVALLARPGAARERLREALSHADVQLVLEDDPNGLEPQVLQAADPQFVVIALEAAIEDALERLDAALSAPGLTLVFDEAELAARRDGWEAQRWGRHLAAKLHGHQQVLPPGAEEEPSLQLEPGHPAPAPAPQEEALQPHLAQALSWADDVPADGLYSPPAHLHEPIALEQTLAALQPDVPEPRDPPSPPQAPAEPAAPAAPPISFDHTAWSLVEESIEAPAPAEVAAPAAAPQPSFDTDHLTLVDLDAAAPAGARAASVLVLAGIGGPDALRRLLGALPASLSVPVLVHMRLAATATWSSRCRVFRRCRCSWPRPASAPRRARSTCWLMISACARPAMACISRAMPPVFRSLHCRPHTLRWCCSAVPTWPMSARRWTWRPPVRGWPGR